MSTYNRVNLIKKQNAETFEKIFWKSEYCKV